MSIDDNDDAGVSDADLATAFEAGRKFGEAFGGLLMDLYREGIREVRVKWKDPPPGGTDEIVTGGGVDITLHDQSGETLARGVFSGVIITLKPQSKYKTPADVPPEKRVTIEAAVANLEHLDAVVTFDLFFGGAFQSPAHMIAWAMEQGWTPPLPPEKSEAN